jgi:magnesium transporter
MARFIEKDKRLWEGPDFDTAERVDGSILEVFNYTPESFNKVGSNPLKQIQQLKDTDAILWVNIDGMEDVELIQKIGDHFDLHPLVMEDIFNTSQRPKFEEFDNCFFIAMKMLSCEDAMDEVQVEHISFVAGKNYLISFQEGVAGDVFNPIRDRLSRSNTKIRTRGTDYLVYSLLDAIVDNYIEIIERFGERIERLERKLSIDPTGDQIQEINAYKMEINFLRKTIRPVRELALRFLKSESEFIEERTEPYLKSLVDHTTHAIEAIETYQIMLNDQLNIYQTSISNKLNEILRVLTVFSVIFIPLTFVAGVYGTNFEYFPELGYKYSYPLFWLGMIALAGGMLYYFRRKKWL